jgi:hypothetical protein
MMIKMTMFSDNCNCITVSGSEAKRLVTCTVDPDDTVSLLFKFNGETVVGEGGGVGSFQTLDRT